MYEAIVRPMMILSSVQTGTDSNELGLLTQFGPLKRDSVGVFQNVADGPLAHQCGPGSTVA